MTQAQCTAQWLPSPGGTNAIVGAVTVTSSGNILAGGDFSAIEGVTANRVAEFTSGAWSPLGAGLYAGTGPFPSTQKILTMCQLDDGTILAGGSYLSATSGGTTNSLILKWDGTSWSDFGSGLYTYLYFGVYNIGAVTSIVQDPVTNDIYVGGFFKLGDNPMDIECIVRWDSATSTWQPLGGGIPPSSSVGPAAVTSILILPDHSLVVGGEFDYAGSDTAAQSIARWDGTTWSSMGPGGMFAQGTPGTVYTLARDPNTGDIYAAGLFDHVSVSAPDDTAVDNIARWDGTQWQALAGGGLNSIVNASIFMPNGDLVVAGHFTDTSVGTNPPASRIARWDGTAWYPMGTGLDPHPGIDPMTLQPYNQPTDDQAAYGLALEADGTLLVGGGFTNAGGAVGSVTSPHLARWGCPAVAPGICCRGSVCDSSLTTQAACNTATNPPALWSSLGSTCNTTGNYSSPCCSADYDKNNTVNVSDIFAFLRGWFSHSNFADANQSGGSPDVSDIFAFLRAWFSTNGHCSTS